MLRLKIKLLALLLLGLLVAVPFSSAQGQEDQSPWVNGAPQIKQIGNGFTIATGGTIPDEYSDSVSKCTNMEVYLRKANSGVIDFVYPVWWTDVNYYLRIPCARRFYRW